MVPDCSACGRLRPVEGGVGAFKADAELALFLLAAGKAAAQAADDDRDTKNRQKFFHFVLS